jgi:hypothetical protein
MSLPCFFAIVYVPSELIVHGNAAAAKQHRGLLRDESTTYSRPVVKLFFLFGMYSRGHKFWEENPFARNVYQAMVPVKDGRAS